MRGKRQSYLFCRVAIIFAFFAWSISVGGKSAQAAQTVRKEPALVTVAFGDQVNRVENLLGCESEVIQGYKPLGAVQRISCSGLELRFAKQQLFNIDYLKSFDFSISLTPYENPHLNPPSEQGVNLFIGMKANRFREVMDLWTSHLHKLGFSELEYPEYGVVKKKQFRYKCSGDGTTHCFLEIDLRGK